LIPSYPTRKERQGGQLLIFEHHDLYYEQAAAIWTGFSSSLERKLSPAADAHLKVFNRFFLKHYGIRLPETSTILFFPKLVLNRILQNA
jgi:hypothetical protein